MDKKKALSLGISGIAAISLAISFLVIATNIKDNSDSIPTYTVRFDTNGGTTINSIFVKQGSKIAKPNNPVKNGYYLLSWKYNDTDWNFEVGTVQSDMTLSATWDYVTYSISYDLNGGTIPEENISNYNIDSNYSFINPSKEHNVFIGWFNSDGTRIDGIHQGMTGDLQLKAYWASNLVVESTDENKGTVNVYWSEIDSNKYTVKHVPNSSKHHLFDGWYDENNTLLSTEEEYTFTVNPDQIKYIYSKYISYGKEDEWNNSHGVNPVMSDDNEYVTYGLYPQSNVSDQALINKLNTLEPLEDFNDYFYCNYNGEREYYTKVKAIIANDFQTQEPLLIHSFDNGVEFEEDEEYWFKLEPINWRIIDQEANSYYLLCEKLIDIKRYHANSAIRHIDDKTIYSNNYEYSDIRKWLNGSFISDGFMFGSNSLIPFKVDNSLETTATPESGYYCNDTFDKVTLLSYSDYLNESYGFVSFSSRMIKTTDFVRACGAQYSDSLDSPYYGYCWTRSPVKVDEEDDKFGAFASRNNKNGTLNYDFVGWGSSCVQPAIKITF